MASITTQNIGAASSTVNTQPAVPIRERSGSQPGLDARQLNQAQQSQIQKVSNQLRPNEQAIVQQQARVEQNPRTKHDRSSDQSKQETEETLEAEDEVKPKDDRKVHVEA